MRAPLRAAPKETVAVWLIIIVGLALALVSCGPSRAQRETALRVAALQDAMLQAHAAGRCGEIDSLEGAARAQGLHKSDGGDVRGWLPREGFLDEDCWSSWHGDEFVRAVCSGGQLPFTLPSLSSGAQRWVIGEYHSAEQPTVEVPSDLRFKPFAQVLVLCREQVSRQIVESCGEYQTSSFSTVRLNRSRLRFRYWLQDPRSHSAISDTLLLSTGQPPECRYDYQHFPRLVGDVDSLALRDWMRSRVGRLGR